MKILIFEPQADFHKNFRKGQTWRTLKAWKPYKIAKIEKQFKDEGICHEDKDFTRRVGR